MEKFPLQKMLPYLVAIVVFVLVSLLYLYPVLEGKALRQDDIVRHKGMSKEVEDFREKTGEEALWTNSMFGGMPAYQISVKYKGNLIRYLDDILKLGLPHPANLVFLYMLGFFILMVSLGVNPWLGIAGALAFSFSSYFFIILEAGHNSKAHAIGYMAPVIAGVLLAYRKKYLAGGLLAMVFMALELKAGHPQITYYLALLLLIFVIAEFISDWQKKNMLHFLKASGILALAFTIAFLTGITSAWTTWEYGKYTIRGKTELSSDEEIRTTGLDKDYATQWSYGTTESWSLLIPNIKGGGSGLIGNNDYALRKVDPQYRQAISQNANRYWGDQPFTSGPVYVGAFVFFLFIYGLFIVKGRVKWWLLAGTLLSVMLAWGKNFMPLTDLFLDWFPLYNKFRAVSMTLVIAEVTIPLLAVLALHKLFTEPEVFKQKIRFSQYRINPFYLSVALTAGLSLLFAIMPGVFFNFLSNQEVISIAQQRNANPEYAAQITEFYINLEIARKGILQADAFRSAVFIVLGALVLLAFSAGKLRNSYTIAAISLLILVDMWPVNRRYLNEDDFVVRSKMERPFQKTPADEIILKDTDPHFRVFNLTVDPFTDARTSYFHKSVGGYHGAKFRRYQELYDYQITNNNFDVLNMLNTKYLIRADENDRPVVVPNPQALGNAWFVTDIIRVNDADEELEALSDFDPAYQVVVDKRFERYLEGFTPAFDPEAGISLTSYAPNRLEYSADAATGQLVVFSEIYYDKGWNAYVNGELWPHFRANYVLRGMVLPAGKHQIEFRFEPRAYRSGERISYAASVVVLLSIAGWVVVEIRKRIQKGKTEQKN